MNRPINNPNLPAGLLDNNCEFFVNGTEIYVLNSGQIYSFADFPAEVLDALREDIKKFPEAIDALVDLGLETEESMLRQYVRCRFGGFDGEPDIIDGQLRHTEYWDCGIRGNCKYEGKLCQSIKVENGHLTKREIEVLKLIANGKLDKEIATILNISELTVPSFTKSIREKGGFARKPDMVKFAIKKNLI
jgi:DNA-binding NarL/FixJ family response regulator